MVVLSSQEEDEQVKMTMCGITDYPGSYSVSRRKSKICVFEYVCRGKGYLISDGKKYYPEAGDVYIARQGTTHTYGCSKKDNWRKIWFNFSGTLVSGLLKNYSIDDIDYVPGCKALEPVFEECFKEMQDNPDSAHYHATMVLHKLIYHISQQVHLRTGDVPDLVLEFKSCLDKEITTGVGLNEIIRKFPLSESQLIRRFKKAYNCTPYAYLLNCRLELAKSMLLNTAYSVSHISGVAGFSNPYYFSALFKKKYGDSPAKYRVKAEDNFSLKPLEQ
jgi:AraC-like DNA-binding protein